MRAIGLGLLALLVAAAGFVAGTVVTRGRVERASALGAVPVTDPADPDIRTLVRLQERMAAALAPPDTAALESLIPDDWRGINAADVVLDRARARAILQQAAGSLVRVVDDSIQVRRYGNVAIMTLRETVTMRVEKTTTVGRLRMTEVWFKRGGNWQSVASQATVIPQLAG